MPNYHRFRSGICYFFTVVVYRRRPIFASAEGRSCLRQAIETVRETMPFELFAIVLLPDHLHTIWNLPTGDANYYRRWGRIKEEFTISARKAGIPEETPSASRRRRGEGGYWQRRFWEHQVRDADDLKRCVDYIHWNPVKHGYVKRPIEWPYSSFARFVASGDYPAAWGEIDPNLDFGPGEWE